MKKMNHLVEEAESFIQDVRDLLDFPENHIVQNVVEVCVAPREQPSADLELLCELESCTILKQYSKHD